MPWIALNVGFYYYVWNLLATVLTKRQSEYICTCLLVMSFSNGVLTYHNTMYINSIIITGRDSNSNSDIL